jgi:hypothetical protein
MFRDGPFDVQRKFLRWLHAAVLVAACAAILLVASGISFWHTDAPGSEATCPICHVAHMPVLPGTAASVPSTPSVVAWVLPAEVRVSHAAPAGLDSPPRGPPA